jgi:enoyl-CoA hydratase/carnithine racemase
VPSRMALARARELILTARTITAAEAHAVGLVDRLVPAGKLEREIKAVIKMLFRAEPGALAETKDFTAAMAGQNLDEQCSAAQSKLLELVNSGTVAGGVQAFAQDELPEWSVAFKSKEPLVHEQEQH